MLIKANQSISLFLTLWLGIFTQLSTLHMGHGHELLPLDQSICSDDCEDLDHHKAGESCDWFIAKRVIDSSSLSTHNFLTQNEYSFIQKWNIKSFIYSNPFFETLSARAPPYYILITKYISS